MRIRDMRIFVMYDLPMNEVEETREYTKFRKELIRLGFYQVQYSVYCKVVPNSNFIERLEKKLLPLIPSRGQVRMFQVTEAQYDNMKFLQGKKSISEEIVGNNNIVIIGEIND